MRITVFGAGYVGLVTAACLAELGNEVLCLERDPARIALLERGQLPIHEPGLAELVTANVGAGRLRFSSDADGGMAELQFIAVGTPPDEDGAADVEHVLQAARTIARRMAGFQVIVTKSTVPIGTAERVRAAVQQELDARGSGLSFAVVSNPEFLKEGAAVHDFMQPDRIVLGVEAGTAGRRAAALLTALYEPLNRHHPRTVWMDTRSAELTKYAANAMLATRISFINEMANLADLIGADIEAVRCGIGADQRIGYSFLYAGCGYGGSCFPKDLQALGRLASEAGQPLRLLRAVEAINNDQKLMLGQRILARFGDDLHGHVFAVWGLAFKPDTDDVRHASALVLIGQLLRANACVAVYDPVAQATARRALEQDRSLGPEALARLRYASDPMNALRGADALAIVTEWKQFRSPDWRQVKALLRQPVVFDGRNLFEPRLMAEAGIEHHSIGRPPRARLAMASAGAALPAQGGQNA
ncbi:UDP-glucose dehydrogenase family protein [Pseudoduganella aquatica]|uniref:UDP-glucose dehydrogenase family protein n=1 Tax=Pseudoduganella aquatica TaxID=2660641 RepID=UPI001E57AAC4|nr:UDP-glucose/GDP-mannose dehydrogenase family protein [Pseudoduganella aquatica]